ncbi:L,D-transpeptidase [Paenibacillus lutrae]|uniref:L,D-transpeptidase family protein n=1 Tax=Paenibacillus lutrae TaxID=2078573 RepID=A0A7X3JY33_9BACL|nr:L,D-transpeptidase [Paenibacillus lutrae]MVO98539.1 L,D-transpeptidase family protein [Paenibacillus lutrae]
MKGKPDEKLAEFLRHNPIDDRSYLKDYIREHRDQRMAWYLLGREYTSRGEHGKAAYCFGQSGEIFEAFEKKKIAVDWSALDPAASWPPQLIAAARRRRRQRMARTGLILLLLALWPTIAGLDPDRRAAVRLPAGAALAAVEPAAGESTLRAYLTAAGEGNPVQSAGALERMLLRDRKGGGEAALLSAKSLEGPGGRWLAWHRPLQPLLSVRSGEPGQPAGISYYDAAACACRPDDPARLAGPVEAWRQKQEQLLVLRSAMEAYRETRGKVPQSPEELLAPYPDNVLPGMTPYMREMFPHVRKQAEAPGGLRGAAGSSAPGDAPAGGSGAAAASPDPALQEPMRIIIDKSTHRMALVSGGTIVRSYKVGLGGVRTPEGEFAISEKVRDPKGKSQGEFGTRGMVLSGTNYAIHGTGRLASIGKDQSLGCVRMGQAEVEELFDMVPLGTKVTIGSGLLPKGLTDGSGSSGTGNNSAGGSIPRQAPFKLPAEVQEKNPGQIYRWLN